jgi:hypothetical protein
MLNAKKAFLLALPVLIASAPLSPALPAESGFSAYALGGNGFLAGAAPPPGNYVTGIASYLTGDISGGVVFGGVNIDVSLDIRNFITGAVNLMVVPKQTILGGTPGASVTVGAGWVDLLAQISIGPLTGEAETDGFGLLDSVIRGQLGWHNGNFHHLIYVQGLLPTGRYDVGFNPNIGLNRPAIDAGWAFTWIEENSKLQFNGVVGFTTSFENELTNYDSGDDFHFEWAIGRDFAPGLTLGIVGYDYRQLTGDSGAGATLGAFKGKVDAVGVGLSYSTKIGDIPFILNARHYEEFNVEKRFDNSVTMVTGTFAF